MAKNIHECSGCVRVGSNIIKKISEDNVFSVECWACGKSYVTRSLTGQPNIGSYEVDPRDYFASVEELDKAVRRTR